MSEKSYLNFKEIIGEAKEYYADYEKLLNFDNKQKEIFFQNRAKTLDKFLELILFSNFPGLSSTQVHYSLFGPFFELMMKLCLLKKNWKKYVEEYYSENKFKTKFEYPKNQLILLLKQNENFSKEQIETIKNTLEFIQVQRNNFLHNPFKGYDHYAVQNQFFELILILNNEFDLGIDQDILFEMGNSIYVFWANSSGIQFKELFEDKIHEIYSQIKPREKSEKELIEQKYYDISNTYTEHDNGEFYPKKIIPPERHFIQAAEPHVLVSDLYEHQEWWYDMNELIYGFAEQSYLSYNLGMYQASISCSVNCCEYVLKYELLRLLKNEKSDLSKLSLGDFVGENNPNLIKLKIAKKFWKEISLLNKIRNALNHYSPRYIEQLKDSGKTLIEKTANPLLDGLMAPITSYNAYLIMQKLLKHFYNEKNTKKFIKEGLKDSKEKLDEIAEKAHEQFGLPKDLIKGVMENKHKHINERLKGTNNL
jgi:hypothetical protein